MSNLIFIQQTGKETYSYSKTLKEKISNITLYEELYDARFDLRKERRIQKDIIIQNTVNQYEKIGENTVRHFNCANDYYYMNFQPYDEVINEFINNESFIFQTDVLSVISDINNSVNESNRFNKCESSDSGYSSYDEYKDL
ncbi:19430_t:CDS:2, partial [Racocetra persica]